MDFHELRTSLRALGFAADKQEVLQLLATHGIPKRPIQRPAPNRNLREPSPLHSSQMVLPQAAFIRVTAQKVIERDPREEVERAFQMFDQVGKGYMDMEDLRRVAQDLGENNLDEEEMRAMIEEYDYDSLGGVSRVAFEAICLD